MNLLKQIRQKLPGLALLSAAFLFCGSAGRACNPDDIDHMLDPENLDMSDRPLEGIVSIQEIITLRRGTDKEVLAPAMYFDDLCLNRAVLLDSSDILSIKAIPLEKQPPYYSLELKLSERGKRHWIGLSLPNKGNHVAFLIDGMVYRTFVPRLFYDDVSTSIVVDGPFDPATAKKLEANASRNHFKLN